MASVSVKTIFIVLTMNSFAGLTAFAQTSYELSCRNKAKEIAAETYKNCVTEQRQSQIEQIRKDYKEKLADLKKHYDNELKNMGGAMSSSANKPNLSSNKETAPQKTAKSSSKMRASGARSLPKKAVRTEVIDLTTPSTESAQVPDESTIQSQNRLNPENENPQDVEIVELPTQE